MTRTLLGALIGLCAAFAVRDLTTALHILLGASGGVSGAVLWWRRHAAAEATRKGYHENLVSLGWQHGKLGTTETTTLRIAIPPREP